MTGTAETEAAEFDNIYKLDIVVIPTNRPDAAYRELGRGLPHGQGEVLRRRRRDRAPARRSKQPVLVGTTSIEKSELLSEILKRKGVRHVVLNAKFHEKEAEIVAQAGRLGMVTIATNMAGRGTDILLGGNAEFMARQDLVKRALARAISAAEGAIHPDRRSGHGALLLPGPGVRNDAGSSGTRRLRSHEAATKAEHDAVIEAGGLHILGTERHESRRVDNQLRGRAGRQGDPGASRFYLSLEDDLMRIFAREWVSTLLQSLGMEEGVPIESRMISQRIEAAQKAVESQNFESRKHVLEYDDVMNKQREAVYGLRRAADGRRRPERAHHRGLCLRRSSSNILDEHAPEKAHPDQWKLEAIFNGGVRHLRGALEGRDQCGTNSAGTTLGEAIFHKLRERYDVKEQILGAPNMRYHERIVML